MKNLATILLILISASVFGQKKMTKKSEIAFAHYKKGEKYEALLIFKELITDYPNSEYYGQNLYNIPTIYQEIDSMKMAIKWFKKVIDDKKLDDYKEDNSRGIFETHTNFKHNASMNIGVINYNNKNYSKALKFYKLADTTYPYKNSSGTGLRLNKIKIASNVSDCYSKLNQIDSAIVVLLPHALNEFPGASNYASNKLISLVKKYKRNSSFFYELDKSLDNLLTIENGIRLNCYGIDVKVFPYHNEELTTEYLKRTNLFKELKKTAKKGFK